MTSAAAFSRREWWAEPSPEEGAARASWARSLRDTAGGHEVRALNALYEHVNRRTLNPLTLADAEANPEHIPALPPPLPPPGSVTTFRR